MFKFKNVRVNNILNIPELRIDAGVTAIIGKSGSGKSTLLRLLNQLDDPTEGEIYWKDQLLSTYEPTELRKQVVMIPQSPIIFDGTVRDNLAIAFSYREENTPDDEALQNALDALLLDKKLTEDANDLSGGEKQRLGIARALLLTSVEVLLLDEPASSLDEDTTQHVIKKLINSAKKHQQQIIMVSHDKQLANSAADELIHLEDYLPASEVNNRG
ncbi:Lipid A export ATP-binding/permease protein MsbA [Lentibacillus sp. JNUCC-1]|uniref:ABC transporter ATP-binding protein n=1 Tax=Lentibacillus sp. JNUCC-1 TaxID=2654513 RepID=UPI0012E777D0|nr:ABC transporter ATP-binding protein [Lentibacillus sp. JNUCC-1]MUV36728.1 Lipid A export ATP-binding/permease protein MsbA [Lentibacillus sp. JNUCC-1]